MSEGPAAKRSRTSGPETLGEDAISFQVITPSLKRLDVPETFRPLMTHQLLGDDETIRGYQNPNLVVELNLATYEVSARFSHKGAEPDCTKVS